MVNSCTQDEFDEQAKVCLMKEFFKTIQEKRKQEMQVSVEAVYLLILQLVG